MSQRPCLDKGVHCKIKIKYATEYRQTNRNFALTWQSLINKKACFTRGVLHVFVCLSLKKFNITNTVPLFHILKLVKTVQQLSTSNANEKERDDTKEKQCHEARILLS